MDLSPFFQSPETSFHKYKMHLHLPSVLHPRSYHLYFCFHIPFRTRTSTVFAAAFKELRKDELGKKRQVSAAADANANQSQCTQADIREHNVFFWNNMIRDYVKNGSCDEAQRLYYQMQSVGMEPDKLVFISVIIACSSLSDLQAGRRIHKDIIVKVFELDVFVGTALASMYVNCGCLEDACQVFDKMPERNVVSWNVVIAGYSQHSHPYEALALFNEMQVQGIKPSSVTMVIVLPICIYLLALGHGRQIHGYVIRCGLESDAGVGIGLLKLYAKCGIVSIAHKLFERMPKRNVVSWTAIIAGYSQNGQSQGALAFFNEMIQCIKPNSVTIASVLPACVDLLALEQGTQIHGYAIRNGFESDVNVGTALVDMYANSGNVNSAQKLFERMPQRNVVSWNAIIAGYSQNDQPHKALTCFNKMQFEKIKPNSITIINLLPVCSHLLDFELGKQIHSYAIRNGFESDAAVGNALVNLYAKFRNVNIAHKLLERLPKQNIVSWTTIIAGYSQSGQPCEALAFFSEMQVQHIKPNLITIISVLPACADLLAVEQGKQIHAYAVRNEFESDVVVGTGLVDMYTKCGNFDIAHKLFERMPKRNVVSWTAIIAGYSQNGHPYQALAYFKAMQIKGIKRNSVTMISILPACADLLAL